MSDATIEAFSPEELRQIQQAPVTVILGAVASEPDGSFGSMKELVGGIRGLVLSLQRTPTPLIDAILQDTDPSTERQPDFTTLNTESARADAMTQGVESAVAALQLLESKASTEEADAFAKALLDAAEFTVRASKTGGFLGLGGQVVTEREAAYVKRLAEALGYAPNAGV